MLRKKFNTGWRYRSIGNDRATDTWKEVLLPHDAVIGSVRDPSQVNGMKKAFFPNGAWEYVNVFVPPEEWKGKEVFLEFEGVQNHALVYVNGNCAASHAYGYTEFTVPLSRYLRFGEKNFVRVVCSTHDDSRWYNGGGIYRKVNLLVGGSFRFLNNGLKIGTLSADEREAVLELSVSLSSAEKGEVRFVLSRGGEVAARETVFICGEGKFRLALCSPALWDDEHPVLYTCHAELWRNGEFFDAVEERFGIRTLSVSAEEGLRVNGKRVLLRGACIHHDNGVLGVRTFEEAEYRRVRILKEAGFNAIRSAHHPASRALLAACDELGVYVMDEAFDMWEVSKSVDDYARDFHLNWRGDVRAMVEKDFDHPSVILYSIGNEIPDLATSSGVERAEAIAREVRRLDASRFTTVAINGVMEMIYLMANASILGEKIEAQKEAERRKDVNEAMAEMADHAHSYNERLWMDEAIRGGCDAVDIAGYNYMPDRYLSDIRKYPGRVIVGSETYAKDIPMMWEHIQRRNNVIGDFTWTGWDYLGEAGIGGVSYEPIGRIHGFYAVCPYLTANCGDIDITGFRMPQSYYREIVFGLRKEPFLSVHEPSRAGEKEYLTPWSWGNAYESWSFPGYEGVPLTVDVYGRGEVELFLNGRSVGKRDCGKNFRTSFDVPFEAGTLEAVCTEDGKEYRHILRSAGEECVIGLFPEAGAQQDGLLFVRVALTDGAGNVHFLKDRPVKLEVAGGRLLGFGSGAYSTEENFCSDTHTTYHGRAFAVILAEAEEVCVTARAEGTEQTSVTVKISEGRR